MANNVKRLSNNIRINWNPTTDDGRVSFEFNKFLLDDQGNPTDFVDPSGQTNMNETIGQVAQRIVPAGLVDPVTGETLPEISGGGVVALIKAVVEQKRDELEREIYIRENRPSDQSTISADPISMDADGTSTATITAQLITSDGSPITQGGYTISFKTDLGELLGDPIDNDDGTYTQELQASTVGGFATVTLEYASIEPLAEVQVEMIDNSPTPTPSEEVSPTPSPSEEVSPTPSPSAEESPTPTPSAT